MEYKLKDINENEKENQKLINSLKETISINEKKIYELEKEKEIHLNKIKKFEEEEKKIFEKVEEERKKINIKHEEEMAKINAEHEENMKKMENLNLYNLNDIISLNFSSTDQKINYSLACLKNDIFAVVEEKLYKEYPEYRETNNFFIQSGQSILRFKTLKENNIKPGLPIMLFNNS